MQQASDHQGQANRSYAVSCAVMIMAANAPETHQLIAEETDNGHNGTLGFDLLEKLSNRVLAYIETGKFPDDHRPA